MIYRIDSKLTSFKKLDFRPGLNLLISDKSKGATERQTRNGAGKSSLTELIHFLTGGSADKDSIFRSEALNKYIFSLEFDLGNARILTERSGQKFGTTDLTLIEGNMSKWPLLPRAKMLFNNHEEFEVTTSAWKDILGELLFGIDDAEDDELQNTKFGPSFRSLFSYFVRRDGAGGFVNPFKQAEKQSLADQQVSISYLLGLDWTIPQQLQYVRRKETNAKEVAQAIKNEELGSIIGGSSAELRTQLTVLEQRANRLRESINTFQVLPEYREFETEASNLTLRLADLSDENSIDRELITELKQSTEAEEAPSVENLDTLYREIGIVLPGTVLSRFEDVRRFHESVIQNRKSYLRVEINAADQRIKDRERVMQNLDRRRSELFGILKSHGALDQLTKFQSELSRMDARTEALRQRYDLTEKNDRAKAQIEIERNQLFLRLIQDYEEQEEILTRAILAFEETSAALYESAGSLTIKESINGPEFDVVIQGDKSKGIGKMQIFCFDMMLMRLCAQRGIGPGFLVHDSHIFDGVDERQVATALAVGAKTAEELNFQYIVTMNSDVVPKEFPSGFDITGYILPVVLTDDETGGLFGFRF